MSEKAAAQRRLAAVVVTDVVGYSRLMEANEVGTLAALNERRQTILEPVVCEHSGRVVKLMGDGALLEFASAVNAVAAAVSLQQKMAEANQTVDEELQIVLRIGINLGEVIGEGADIYGDGVNIAARLETFAEPGGVCISGTVHEHVQRQLPLSFQDLGEQTLKNISRPVRVHRIALGIPSPRAAGAPRRSQPCLVVLPFTNMSSDPDQEYFADGMTEDLITELSRFRNLLVIARNSSFHFKGTSPKIQDVARELGVHWVVEGSVRKAGNRVRVTAQLIDAATGAHVWAERYDRMLEDVFALQDEVVQAIAGTIPGHLDRIAAEHARRIPPANLTAFEHHLRGRWALRHSSEGLGLAIKHLEKAIEADPAYAPAHADIANAYSYGIFALGLEPAVAIERACSHAARAVTLDGGDAYISSTAAVTYILSGKHDLAKLHSERAIAINPNHAGALWSHAFVLSYIGRQSEAMEYFTRIDQIEPYAPDDSRQEALCDCLFMQRKYETLLGIYQGWHDMPIHLRLIEAAARAHLGQLDEATAAIAAFHSSQASKPDPQAMISLQMQMLARQEDRDHWLDGYRKAGLDV